MAYYEYRGSFKNIDSLHKLILPRFEGHLEGPFDGLTYEGDLLTVKFFDPISDEQKTDLDLIVTSFDNTEDAEIALEKASFKRKKAGQRFDDFTIAVLTNEGFADSYDVAILKYKGFDLVRSLVLDGLFHYALRVYARDIMPSEGLTTKQKNIFLRKLRKLTGKFFPNLDLSKVEAGTI